MSDLYPSRTPVLILFCFHLCYESLGGLNRGNKAQRMATIVGCPICLVVFWLAGGILTIYKRDGFERRRSSYPKNYGQSNSLPAGNHA